jgi:hypothetical protein
MDFNEFEMTVHELGKDVEDYAKRRESVFQQTWNKQLDAASLRAAGSAVEAPFKGEYDKLHKRLVDICDAYLAMREREQAREMVGGYPGLIRQLNNHLGWSTRRVETEVDRPYMMRGLAAISFADLRTDMRDLLIAMGEAYLRCYRAGVFMSIPLVRVAEISNPIPRPPHETSMRDFLLTFEESAYFQSSVVPKLK